MNTWTNIWVYGYKTALEAFLDTKRDENDNLPHEILCVGPVYPQEQTGTTEDGMPIYSRKGGNPKVLWLFSLYGDAETLVDEFKVLNGPYVVHDKVEYDYEDLEGNVVRATRPITIKEIRELYPEFCVGQGIPYIC